MHKHLLKYLDRFNLIHTHQSGFQPQHSCQSALTCLVDRLLSFINQSKLNGVVFLDLKKAFDRIDHQILLKKKKKMYQISGIAIQFKKKSYISQRKQKVFVAGRYSPEGPVEVGVPQQGVCSWTSSLQYLHK